MKKLFASSAILTLALFATSAIAQFAPVTPATATIAVKAVIEQSAALVLSASSVNFDVVNAAVPTNGSNSVTVVGKVSIRKGGGAIMEIGSTDLTGVSDGGKIPAALLSYKTGVSAGFSPLDNDPAMNAPLAINTNSGGILNATPAGLTTPLTFQLAPLPNLVPDVYTGTVTIILFVV